MALNYDVMAHIFTFLRVDEIARISHMCKLFNKASKNLYSYKYNSVYNISYPMLKIWSKSKKIRWLKTLLPPFPLYCEQLFVGYYGNVEIIRQCPYLKRVTLSKACFDGRKPFESVKILAIKELHTKCADIDLAKLFPNLEELDLEELVIKNSRNLAVFINLPPKLKTLNIISVDLDIIIPRHLPQLKILYVSDTGFVNYFEGCQDSLEQIYIMSNVITDPVFWNNFPNLTYHTQWIWPYKIIKNRFY